MKPATPALEAAPATTSAAFVMHKGHILLDSFLISHSSDGRGGLISTGGQLCTKSNLAFTLRLRRRM
jgi:hypothetical protein